ncbi:MAG: ATP-binding protein [Dehalococcoidia bacterium]
MWQVMGHEKAVALLERSLRGGKLCHAHLFVGPPHVGKMTLALNLAQALNCQGEERPCGECPQCQRIARGVHADVQVVGLDGGMEIGIDQIREVQHAASLKPFEGGERVFIIDGADHLSHEAANCLLKTLEEPPPNVQLILLAVNEGLLPPTVLSRCQKLELGPLPAPVVEEVLGQRWGVPVEQARVLARLSGGCLGWAVAASSAEGLLSERAQRLAALCHLAGVGRGERFAYAAQLANQFSRDRESVQEVLSLWLGWWRDLMLIKMGCGNFITNVDQEAKLCDEAQGYRLREIKGFAQSLQRAMEQLDQNANPRLVLEVLMLAIPKGKEEAKSF